MQRNTKKDLIIHLIVYISVNVLLAVINLIMTPDYYWAKWPHLGWGIGLFFQAFHFFVVSKKSSG